MFIHTVSHYLPRERVPNEYFSEVNGLSDSWIFERTGIKTRSRAGKDENTTTMAVEAVKNAMDSLPFDIRDVDLIVGASYTPYDTVATMGHVVQREFHIPDAQVVYISSACSSLINALEIVEGYFAMGKSKHALLIASEHNTAFSDDTCEKSGHLWGDGASALFISDEPMGEKPAEILSIYSRGLGHISKGPEGVYLTPGRDGLQMPEGRDVFIQACQYMRNALANAAEDCGLSVENLDWVIPHQANHRIIKNLAGQLALSEDKIFTNIRELGNTGSASTGICLSQNMDTIQKDTLLGITVFGGGYSTGAAILRY